MYQIESTLHRAAFPEVLAHLAEAWENDDAVRHAALSAVLLYDAARRPGVMATRLLPAAVEHACAMGPQGVDGVLLSALSAAAAHDPGRFGIAVDDLLAHAPRWPVVPAKAAFMIPFVDFDSLPVEVRRPAAGSVKYGGPLTEARVAELMAGAGWLSGSRAPAALAARHGDIGAERILHLFRSSHVDQARQLLTDLRALAHPRQVVNGFGFTVRRQANGLDERHDPGGEAAAGWRDAYDRATASLASYYGGMAACFGALGVVAGLAESFAPGSTSPGGAIALAFGLGAKGLSLSLEQIGEVVRETTGEIERVVRVLDAEQTGDTTASEGDDQVKFPVPDGWVGSGRPTIFEILCAAEAYARRLDPYSVPREEELGGGVTYARVPQQGDVDPAWETIGRGMMSDDELRHWIAFLQAKLFDSLVNPVPPS